MRSLLGRMRDRFNAAAGLEIVETLFYEMHSASPPCRVTPAPGVTIERLSAGSARELAKLSGGLNPELIDARLRSGQACYAAYVDGRPAHYSWVRSSGVQSISEIGAEYPVLPGEFWIYHCWTESWARGKRIYPSVLAQIANDYFDSGFKTGRIYTTLDNEASQKGILRVGFVPKSSLRALRVGRRRFALKQRPSK